MCLEEIGSLNLLRVCEPIKVNKCAEAKEDCAKGPVDVDRSDPIR